MLHRYEVLEQLPLEQLVCLALSSSVTQLLLSRAARYHRIKVLTGVLPSAASRLSELHSVHGMQAICTSV